MTDGKNGMTYAEAGVDIDAGNDLVELRIDPVKPAQFIRDRIGAQYDYKGILLSQVLALGRHDKSRWFCSEICAAALDLPNPQRVSPQFLFDVVTWDSRQPH